VLRLYDAVAAGMWAYSNAAFRVETLARRRFELEPGTLIVATHRRETDVPLLAPPLYYRAGLWRKGATPMSFAARDDMFLRGFFAGFPPTLSPRLRRLLYPVGVGRWLPSVEVHPIRSANSARLAELLATQPAERLEDLAPATAVARFAARAEALRLPRPETAGAVLRAEYADLLWTPVSRADVALPDFWSRRAAEATRDFRALVDLVRLGGILLVFPEGRPSPVGDLGPLRPGIGALVRRATPRRIQPLGLAYDPLVHGRTRVVVSIPDPVDPPADNVEEALLALMRRAVPLTAGQLVASALTTTGSADLGELAAAADRSIDEARAEGRPIDPSLLRPHERRRRLAEAIAAGFAQPRELDFLAREFASARAA
jgi:1-acyl-sn-glycerol-3-phosphate acyltransferase